MSEAFAARQAEFQRQKAARTKAAAALCGDSLWKWSLLESEAWFNYHPLDFNRLAAMFVELYAIGERPTPAEMTKFLSELRPGVSRRQLGRITDVWRKLIANPLHNFRSFKDHSFGKPFLVSERICGEHNLIPLDERVLSALAESAARYLAAEAADPRSREAERAYKDVLITQRALLLRGVWKDWYPHHFPHWNPFRVAGDPYGDVAIYTTRGREKLAEREPWRRNQLFRDDPSRQKPDPSFGSTAECL